MQRDELAAGRCLPWGSQTGPCWYVLQTLPNGEYRAAESLRERGITAYVPGFEGGERSSGCGRRVAYPLFPGYVFARFADTAATLLSVLRTPGALRLLGLYGVLVPVPDVEIESLRLILRWGAGFQVHSFLRPGIPVRVSRGAMAGVEGRLLHFTRKPRLVLWIQALGESLSVEVDTDEVEPLDMVRVATTVG
jgi:transcription termination/antitermination protein NusG